MHVTVDIAGAVGLDEPGDFTAFDLQVAGGDKAAALEALGDDGAPAPENDHVFVAVDRVRSLARIALGDGVDFAWESGFTGMLGYAGSKGWMSDDGAFIKAHLVSAA